MLTIIGDEEIYKLAIDPSLRPQAIAQAQLDHNQREHDEIIQALKEKHKEILEKKTKDGHIICPFCGQDEFDSIGLKYHLNNYCVAYRNVEVLGLWD